MTIFRHLIGVVGLFIAILFSLVDIWRAINKARIPTGNLMWQTVGTVLFIYCEIIMKGM